MLILCMILVLTSMILSVINKIDLSYPLFFALVVFSVLGFYKGTPLERIKEMIITGGKKCFIVLKVFVLIGALTSLWMSSGTIPSIIYWGIRFMNPDYFIFFTFLITSIVSILIGTSFGTISTIGIAFLIMAREGGISIPLVTGAIMSGAYLGDRCSPMSSSAHLICNITGTSIYTNIKNMIKSGWVAFVITSILYLLLSVNNPIVFPEKTIGDAIAASFNLSLLGLVPAIIVIVASIMRVDVKKSMGLSIISAGIISCIIQGYSVIEVIRFLVFGFRLQNNEMIGTILNKGGIISMGRAGITVFISCALAGVFEGTQLLADFEDKMSNLKTDFDVFLATTITGVTTAAFGCSQTISIILTEQLLKKTHKKIGSSKEKQALFLEDTSILLSAIIPWNLAAFLPLSILGVGMYEHIPFSFYLYLVPITNLIIYRIKAPRKQ